MPGGAAHSPKRSCVLPSTFVRASRFALAALLLLAASAPLAAAPISSQGLTEDDPKIARSLYPYRRPVPRFKLSYRYLPIPAPDGTMITFHAVGFDVYPLSSYIRIGFGVDGGYGGGRLGMFYASIAGTIGVQYPWRVTPFLEGRFALGLVGGRFQGDLATSVMLQGGLEGGIEFFAGPGAGSLFFDLTFGYSHPYYRAPDVIAFEADPSRAPLIKKFQADVFTFKLGVGF